MSTQDPGRAPASPALAAVPRIEDIPTKPDGGFDPERVREAFEAFRRSEVVQSILSSSEGPEEPAHPEPAAPAAAPDAEAEAEVENEPPLTPPPPPSFGPPPAPPVSPGVTEAEGEQPPPPPSPAPPPVSEESDGDERQP